MGRFLLDNFYLLNLVITTGYVCALLVYLSRFNPDNPSARAFQRMLLTVASWALFDFIAVDMVRHHPPETAFATYRWLSFMFLAFPPAGCELLLSLIMRPNWRHRLLLYTPYAILYILALAMPGMVRFGFAPLPVGFQGALGPWNLFFKLIAICTPLALLIWLGVDLRRDDDPLLRKEKLLLLIGGSAMVGGIVASHIYSFAVAPGFPLMGNTMAVFLCLAAYLGLRRYGRVLSPRVLYDTVVRTIPNPLVMVRGGKVIWANNAMADLLGLDDWRQVVHREAWTLLDQGLYGRMEAEELAAALVRGDLHQQVVSVAGAGGKAVPCLVSSASLDRQEPEQGSLAALLDLTEHQRAEEERVLREKTQAAMETAGAICHELTQPMQVLTNRVELMMLHQQQEELVDDLKKVLEQAGRMAEITKRLQGITRYRTRPYLDDVNILDIRKSSE